MSNKINPVKGTQDFYPEQMAIRTWLYNQVRHVSELYGYQEYEAPLLEPLELYAAKSGEEIVEKQSYVFTDRSGNKITLRPELTPSLARMVASKQKQLAFPLRWWSFGPFWRYEKPQKGRTREFFQWNIDQLGNPSAQADAEIIIIAANFLKNVGLEPNEFKIKVNNRKIIESELEGFGIPEKFKEQIYQLIDRKDKMSHETWVNKLEGLNIQDFKVSDLENFLNDTNLWKKSSELSTILEIVDDLDLSDCIEYSPSIIRGLLYYTSTVFEAWDTKGEFRALFGGGRYDNLVKDVGGDPVGGVGFAAGDKVITLLLESYQRLPNLSTSPANIFMTLFNKESIQATNHLSNKLRLAGFNVLSHLEEDKLGKQFKIADKNNINIVIVLGPEEINQDRVTIKLLSTGDQKTIPQDSLIQELHNILEEDNPS